MRKITSILMILMMLFSFTISVNAETVVTFTDSEQAKPLSIISRKRENLLLMERVIKMVQEYPFSFINHYKV